MIPKSGYRFSEKIMLHESFDSKALALPAPRRHAVYHDRASPVEVSAFPSRLWRSRP
jgi:hypothetical protein